MPSAKHAVPAAAGALAASVPAALGALPAAALAVQPPARAAPDTRVTHQMPAARPLVTKVTSVSAEMSYLVVAGDTLSGIAGRACGNPDDWPGIWHDNQAAVPDSGVIVPGQVLRFTCETASPAQLAASSPPAPPPRQAPPRLAPAQPGAGSGQDLWCQLR